MWQICFICLSAAKSLRTVDKPLQDWHIQLCKINIQENLLYCSDCAHLLKKTYNFKQKCLEAYDIFKKWVTEIPALRIQLNDLKSKLPPSPSLGLSDGRNHKFECIKYTGTCIETPDIVIQPLKHTHKRNTSLVTNKKESKKKCIKDSKLNFKSSKKVARVKFKKPHVIFVKHFIESNKEVQHSMQIKDNNSEKEVGDTSEIQNSKLVDTKSHINLDVNMDAWKVEYEFIKSNNVNSDVVQLCNEKPETKNCIIKNENIETNNSETNNSNIEIEKQNHLNVVLDVMKSESDSGEDNNEVEYTLKNLSIFGGELRTNCEIIETKFENELPYSINEIENDNWSDDDDYSVMKWKEAHEDEKEDIAMKFLDDQHQYGNQRADMGEVRENILALENKEFKDREGNLVDMNCIMENLDKLSKTAYFRLKKCLLEQNTLTSDVIHLLSIFQKQYNSSKSYTMENLYSDDDIRREFENRQNYDNYVNSQFKCTLCYQGFKHRKMLEYHKAAHHDASRPVACEVCAMRFRTKRALSKHVLSHRAVFRCNMCPLVTNHKTSMLNHVEIHQGVLHPCKVCSSQFGSASALAAHMNNVHRTQYICRLCARNFQSALGLKLHSTRKHSDESPAEGPASARCEMCNITFVSEDIYKHHLKRTHGEERSSKKPTYTCKVCNITESSYGRLALHYGAEHPGLAVSWVRDPCKYLCHQCGKQFRDMPSLNDHKNMHLGIKPYACDKCPKAFHKKFALKAHMEYHRPPTKACQYCGKKFHSQCNLYTHMKVHTDSKRYICEICSKAFLYRCTLKEHIQSVHFNIRRKRNK